MSIKEAVSRIWKLSSVADLHSDFRPKGDVIAECFVTVNGVNRNVPAAWREQAQIYARQELK